MALPGENELDCGCDDDDVGYVEESLPSERTQYSALLGQVAAALIASGPNHWSTATLDQRHALMQRATRVAKDLRDAVDLEYPQRQRAQTRPPAEVWRHTLAVLAKRIAETSDAWFLPGVRIVDPQTGASMRFRAWVPPKETKELVWVRDNYGETENHLFFVGDREWYRMIQRGVAAGPDLTDAATLGALCPNGQIRLTRDLLLWQAWKEGCKGEGQSREEAIAKAWLKANEEKT